MHIPHIPTCPLFLATLLAATGMIACDGSAPDVEELESPTASPAAVVAHLRAAEESRSYGAMLEVMVPEHRGSFVWSAWFGAAYRAIGADAEVAAAYEAINARYGLDPKQLSSTSGEAIGRNGLAQVADEAFKDVDIAALLTDLVEFTTEGKGFFGPEQGTGEVAIEGDRAVATVGGSKLVLRHLEGGGWYWFPEGSEDG